MLRTANPRPGLALWLTWTWLLCGDPAAAETISFREVSAEWGLRFRHHNGGSGLRYYPETDGSGVVLFDYDTDGDLDLFFVDSAALPGYEGEPPRSILYRNDGGARFVDVTERSGIRVAGYGMGGTSGDVDNDGDPDLYITQFGANQLFRNNGDGSFSDVTEAAGVGDPSWSMSAALADVDRDGDLDLYVANYIDYSIEEPILCFNEKLGLGAYCHPELFEPLADRFYANRGDGTFEERTAESGFGSATGKAMGVVFADFDNDGWVDLYVANDTTPNFLFRNRGNGTFLDASLLSGTAFSDRGLPEAGMGVAIGDVDENGFLDLYVTNFAMETNALYRNLGNGNFVDSRHALGVAQSSLEMLGFGTAFADFDLDGDLDLAIANGHILDNVELMESRKGITYRQRNQILVNLGQGSFRELTDSGLSLIRASRGLATGDLDGDGDLDLVITNSNDDAEVYENAGLAAGGWLQIDLGGTPTSSSGVGSRVEIEAAGRVQFREIVSTDSYLSQSSQTAHFGLGEAPEVQRIRIRWSCGAKQVLRRLPANRRILVPGPLRTFRARAAQRSPASAAGPPGAPPVPSRDRPSP